MKPKKTLIEKATQNGTIDRVNQLLSATHLLICTANNYLEESAELLKNNGMMLGELKKSFNDYVHSADRYFYEFGLMIDGESAKMSMFNDIDEFDIVFRQYSKIAKEWEPKKICHEKPDV